MISAGSDSGLPETFGQAEWRKGVGKRAARKGQRAETGIEGKGNSCEILACFHSWSNETSFCFYLVHKLAGSQALKGEIPKQQGSA